jgi:uncharacterized protein YgbK (DUF1537 family)
MARPLLAFYGDDFTGSTDAMEMLHFAGLRTVLFLDPPTAQQLSGFENLRAFGIAGGSRSMSPAEMDAHLRPALLRLRESGAAIVHYKVCSTCDSSPQIGSIGRALELGRDVFGPTVVPILIGAPELGRYQVFGNLFARSGLDTEPHRLDRHPTMTHHPITPMNEADLRLHFAEQTDLPIGLFDVLQLNEALTDDWFATLASVDEAAVLFDVLYPEHLPRIGDVIARLADRASPQFVIGSSGVESALAAFWTQSGQMDALRTHAPGGATFPAARQLLGITGSCSPVNDRQIAWAEQHGGDALPLHPARLIDPETSESEIQHSVGRALDRLRSGANVILHSSRGPNDPRIAETVQALRALGFSDLDVKLRSGRMLGPQLGQILVRILREHPVERVLVTGGDTSGYVARELGITSLEPMARISAGLPLCRTRAGNVGRDLEICFKGGQIGRDNIWSTILHGTA